MQRERFINCAILDAIRMCYLMRMCNTFHIAADRALVHLPNHILNYFIKIFDRLKFLEQIILRMVLVTNKFL